MLDDPERQALEQIKRYLDAGDNVDDVDDAGWGEYDPHSKISG